MQSSTPFSFAGALILLPLAVLTVFWPLRSVALFALVAPFGNLPIWLGWDPRVYWGAMLGIRMFYDRLLYPNRSTQLPRYAISSWLLFVSLATLGLYGSAAALPAADVADAFSIFFYFMGGSMYLFAAVWFLNRESDTTVLLTSLSSASLAVSLWAIAEAWANYGTDASTRVGATFGNANYLATNLALSSTSLLIAARYRSGRLRAFLLISCIYEIIARQLRSPTIHAGWTLRLPSRQPRI